MGKQVGNYIQKLREAKGLGLRQLGDQISLSPSHLSMVEKGKREVSITVLYPIIEALDGNFVNALRFLALDAGVPHDVIIHDSVGDE